MVIYRKEAPADAPAIESLLDLAFGPNRQAKASYAFRRGVLPVTALSRVAIDEDAGLVGTIRYWLILVGTMPSLLLGPLGVVPERRGEGIGRTLIKDTLEAAADLGATSVFLVGEAAYYHPLGFQPAGHLATMQNENPTRLHGRTLGAATCLPTGPLRPWVADLRAAG